MSENYKLTTMKELSIEEKAKAYDELKVKASRIYHKENDVLIMHTIEDLFPELKESEDERIRKAISQCVEDMRGQFEKLYNVHHKDAIAWLEKQGGIQDMFEQLYNDIIGEKMYKGFKD